MSMMNAEVRGPGVSFVHPNAGSNGTAMSYRVPYPCLASIMKDGVGLVEYVTCVCFVYVCIPLTSSHLFLQYWLDSLAKYCFLSLG